MLGYFIYLYLSSIKFIGDGHCFHTCIHNTQQVHCSLLTAVTYSELCWPGYSTTCKSYVTDAVLQAHNGNVCSIGGRTSGARGPWPPRFHSTFHGSIQTYTNSSDIN